MHQIFNIVGRVNRNSLPDDIVPANGLILHSDNGSPMKGKNMLFAVNALGVTAHFSRPGHSNDNAFIEASFATLKHCHYMLIPKSFSSLAQCRAWCNEFYNWYNDKHLHSGINLITPNQCHEGLGPLLMMKRNEVIAKFRKEHPEYSAAEQIKLFSMPKEVKLIVFSISVFKELLDLLKMF